MGGWFMNEIGEKLQEARKAKGYTLDDLQQMTKIQKRYLIAIEEGNFDVMPGKFYARAFIKQYADTVGLNGDQLLEQYTDAVPQTHDEEYVEKVNTNQTRSENHVTNELVEKIKNMLPTILIVLLVLRLSVEFGMRQLKLEIKTMGRLFQKTLTVYPLQVRVNRKNQAKKKKVNLLVLKNLKKNQKNLNKL